MTIDEIYVVRSQLQNSMLRGASWLIGERAFLEVVKMRDHEGRYLFLGEWPSGKSTLLGIPVKRTANPEDLDFCRLMYEVGNIKAFG